MMSDRLDDSTRANASINPPRTQIDCSNSIAEWTVAISSRLHGFFCYGRRRPVLALSTRAQGSNRMEDAGMFCVCN